MTLLREYRRLAGLFDAEFSSFERKRFVNLSHASQQGHEPQQLLRTYGEELAI